MKIKSVIFALLILLNSTTFGISPAACQTWLHVTAWVPFSVTGLVGCLSAIALCCKQHQVNYQTLHQDEENPHNQPQAAAASLCSPKKRYLYLMSLWGATLALSVISFITQRLVCNESFSG